jgi:AraC-like DNA-binding protein
MLRVHAFIEARLGDPELTPGAIAAAHHISFRYPHRLFEPQETTVAGWIRRRRLERCRRDLLDPALRWQPVAPIGARWGLANPAHFGRAFRAAYGVPPAEYRALAASSDGDAGGPLIEELPPSVRPCGHGTTRSAARRCGVVASAHASGGFHSVGAAAGTAISGASSGGPASSSRIRLAGSSLSRAASTQPALPAPAMR